MLRLCPWAHGPAAEPVLCPVAQSFATGPTFRVANLSKLDGGMECPYEDFQAHLACKSLCKSPSILQTGGTKVATIHLTGGWAMLRTSKMCSVIGSSLENAARRSTLGPPNVLASVTEAKLLLRVQDAGTNLPASQEPQRCCENRVRSPVESSGLFGRHPVVPKHIIYLVVSWNRGTPSYHPFFVGIFMDFQWNKPSIWGYPHLWKPLFDVCWHPTCWLQSLTLAKGGILPAALWQNEDSPSTPGAHPVKWGEQTVGLHERRRDNMYIYILLLNLLIYLILFIYLFICCLLLKICIYIDVYLIYLFIWSCSFTCLFFVMKYVYI